MTCTNVHPEQCTEHMPEQCSSNAQACHLAHATVRNVTDGTNEESGSIQELVFRKQRARTMGISSRWEQRMNQNRANRYAVTR